MMTETPLISKPVLPARPLICLYLALTIKLIAIFGVFKITAFAGKLIRAQSGDGNKHEERALAESLLDDCLLVVSQPWVVVSDSKFDRLMVLDR